MERGDPTPSGPLNDAGAGGGDAALSDLLERAARGEAAASAELLPLVYDHLRAMARARLAHEPAGQTLQATALVHEAYLRLVGSDRPWNDKRHFYAAAALAMRRILVDRARAKQGAKRGGGAQRVPLEVAEAGSNGGTGPGDGVDLVALEDAMRALEAHDPGLAEVVHLRYFAGLSTEEVAAAMGVSARTINREWLVARAWLLQRMEGRG